MRSDRSGVPGTPRAATGPDGVRLGRLGVRPGAARPAEAGAGEAAPTRPPPPGLQPLGLGERRDGLLLVPPRQPAGRRLPLVVALHGAGGTGRQMADILGGAAEAGGFLVLAPDSRSTTWDVIAGGYGPDVRFLDAALGQVFAWFDVEPGSLAVAGFSDGASYALSLGIANGDLLRHVLAYSPGFAAPAVRHGSPRCYVSHGVRDTVLPVDRCSRRLVPQLERGGYDVRYHEFPGGHRVPEEIVEESIAWWLHADG